jgi:hypothetical protein
MKAVMFITFSNNTDHIEEENHKILKIVVPGKTQYSGHNITNIFKSWNFFESKNMFNDVNLKLNNDIYRRKEL